jgi:hypothetical protein
MHGLHSTQIILPKVLCFSKIYYHASFRVPVLSVASVATTLQVAAAMLLLSVAEN